MIHDGGGCEDKDVEDDGHDEHDDDDDDDDDHDDADDDDGDDDDDDDAGVSGSDTSIKLCSKPATPTKVDSLSNSTKITVRWEKNSVPSAELPGGRITHYRLFMDDGLFGDFQQVAYLSSSLSQMTLYDLVPGRSYKFKVVAGNFNQEGDYSDSGLHFACTLPSGLAAP